MEKLGVVWAALTLFSLLWLRCSGSYSRELKTRELVVFCCHVAVLHVECSTAVYSCDYATV